MCIACGWAKDRPLSAHHLLSLLSSLMQSICFVNQGILIGLIIMDDMRNLEYKNHAIDSDFD
jgi:hypothetical protein